MALRCIQQKIVCSGVVVETFEKGGEHLARVSLKPTCIELPMDAHLGDSITIDGSISIRTIVPSPVSTERSHVTRHEDLIGGTDR